MQTPEEVLELAKSAGAALTDEQLESIKGGSDWSSGSANAFIACGRCGAEIKFDEGVPGTYPCPNCGHDYARVDENGTVWRGTN